MMIFIGKFTNSRGDHYGFNYYFEKVLEPGQGVIVPMPLVTPNKRSVNDIGWMTDGTALSMFGTLSPNPQENKGEHAFWQEINPDDDICKVVSGLKAINNGTEPCTVIIRVIMC